MCMNILIVWIACIYFVSTPNLAFETMLKMTNVKIELLTDIDIVLMAEKAIRGGLTQVVRKHGIANNKYVPTYDKTKKTIRLCNESKVTIRWL